MNVILLAITFAFVFELWSMESHWVDCGVLLTVSCVVTACDCILTKTCDHMIAEH